MTLQTSKGSKWACDAPLITLVWILNESSACTSCSESDESRTWNWMNSYSFFLEQTPSCFCCCCLWIIHKFFLEIFRFTWDWNIFSLAQRRRRGIQGIFKQACEKSFTFRFKELFMMLSLQSVRHSNGDQELKVNKKRTRIQINFLLIAQFKQLFFYRRRPDWDKLSQRGKLIEKENASQLHCENNRLGKKHF